jgi:hypothetical protein
MTGESTLTADEKIRKFLSDRRDTLKAAVYAVKNERFLKKPDVDSPFDEIEFGEELKEIPDKYRTDVLNFIGYVEEKKNLTFEAKFRNKKTGEEKRSEKPIPYVHRWTVVYRRAILAKFYQLEAGLGDDVHGVSMITLTVSQRGKDPEECLFNLKKYYNLLFKLLRKLYGTNDYFYVLEPHKTGYPHMHILYLRSFSSAEKEHIRNIWSNFYGVAAHDIGVNFSEPKASDSGEFAAGSIARVRGYLMKYVSKGLHSESMKPSELLFNALLKKTKTRLWGCSRRFSQIMKKPVDAASNEWECVEVIEKNQGEFVKVRWTKESGLNPETVKTWKWYNTVPTWCLSDRMRDEYNLHGFKLELFGEFTRIFEPVWIPASCV